MLEASISALIPNENSEEFYKAFYNQYNLIQIIDITISFALEKFTEEDFDSVINLMRGYNGDQDYLAVFTLGMGVMNPALMRRRKESQNNLRGVSIDLFESIKQKGISPLGWYKNCIEFLMLYSICEQSLKEFATTYGGSTDKSLQEDKIIYRLFEALDEKNLRNQYLKEISDNTSEVLDSQNRIQAVWMYFTILRHCIAHSGGRCTDKIKEKLDSVIRKNIKELESVEDVMLVEIAEEYPDGFFVNILNDSEILLFSENYLNFFRNLALGLIESIEKVIHSDEFTLADFDPYKL